MKKRRLLSILLSLVLMLGLMPGMRLTAFAAFGYSDLTPGTLILVGDRFDFNQITSFKFADYNDSAVTHEVKGSDFQYNQATLSTTDGYYSFGSTKILPVTASPGGLLVTDYDSDTHMVTFGVQNITYEFDESTGTLSVGGTGVVPRYLAMTGDNYGVVGFTKSNLVKHLIIDATNMIAIKNNAFMAYTNGCVLEDVTITSTSSTPLTIENEAFFYMKDSSVTITVDAKQLATVTSCPVDNYSSPVNLIYSKPATFKKNALTALSGNLKVTFPNGCKVHVPARPQFVESGLQREYDQYASWGGEQMFWEGHSELVEGTDYVIVTAHDEDLAPRNASLVVGTHNKAVFADVASTGVTLDQSAITIDAEGNPVKLTATVTPFAATNWQPKWSVSGSSNVVLYKDSNCSSELGADEVAEVVYVKGTANDIATVTATTVDTNKTASCAVNHAHDFTYSASGATITATCGATGCALTSATTLTITAPTLTTYGQTGQDISASATLTGLSDFNTATGLTVTADSISYYKATKSGDTYTKVDALASAPANAGDYLAEITLSSVKTSEGEGKSVTASVGYTIAKAATNITTAPTAGEITYGQTLADSTLTGGEASVAGSFAWKDSTVAPAVSDSQTTEYDVVFTPTDGNYSTAECKVKLTVKKAAPAVTAPTAKTLTFTGSAQELVNAGSTEDGKLYYAVTTEKTAPTDDNLYTTSIPSKTDAGTYYVWYKVVGDENHSDTTPASVTVTIQRRSSGGGSSTTTVTVPVTSDAAPGTVPVKASVSGTTATVTKLTDEQLAQVTTNKSGNKDADAETETNSVVIDVSGVAKDVKTATIPTETVKAVEETGSNLKVTLTDGSVEFDATAQAIITDEAKGTTIQVNLDAVKVTTLTSAQQSAVESLEVEVVLDAYVTSNGQRISDFKGGSATLSVPYTLKDGQAAQGIVVWYVASDGTRTQVDASYDGKNVVFTVPHFSNYVIAYDAAKAAACPQDTTCPISAFTDARTTAWYHDGVHWAIENSVMNGVGDGKFAPNGITTRAQVVTMLWRLEGSPAYVGMSEFSDVDNEQWYGPAIRWASAEGIVNGYDDGRFGANDAVTREQLVTILYRYAQYKKMDVSVGEDTNILSYDDAFDVSEWAIPAMQWACGSGIVNGIDKNGTLMLAPSDASTRAVVATMFWRFSK